MAHQPSSLAREHLFAVTGKVALVTGGGTGIGQMIAAGLAENGAKVYIVGRRKKRLDEAVAAFTEGGGSGRGTMHALVGDVSHKDSISALVAAFTKLESSLSVLVNAAGIQRLDPKQADPEDTENLLEALNSSTWGDWQDTMDVNISSLYFSTVGFAPLLYAAFLASPSTEAAPQATPVVIQIGSLAGFHNSRIVPVSYQVSKSAVMHLTKVLATRLTPFHIRVNALAPGLFPSEMSDPDPAKLRETHAGVFKALPEGRAGGPEDIAGPAIFLASRAGTYLNGVTLDAGGGRSMFISGAMPL